MRSGELLVSLVNSHHLKGTGGISLLVQGPGHGNERRDDPHVEALIREATQGDPAAFEELVFLHREAVWRVAYRSTRDEDSALDIVQEVFIRAWRALSVFQQQSRFSTWLHRITINVCVDHARRRQRHDSLIARESSDRAMGSMARENQPSASPEQAAMEVEFARRVQDALLQLSRRQREAFQLRYLAELPITEVAQTMNCTEGAVKRHLFRAVERLKDILG